MTVIHEQASKGYHYGTSLIFSFQYPTKGPGFQLEKLLQCPDQPWTSIIQNWIQTSSDTSFALNDSKLNLENLVPAVSGAVVYNGDPDASTLVLAEQVKRHIAPPTIEWDISPEIAQFDNLAKAIWTAWDRKLPIFESAVRTTINQCIESIEYAPSFGGESIVQTPIKTTTYGNGVAAFIEDFRYLDLFDGQAAHRTKTEKISPYGGCFRPGTKVLTPAGSINVEDLREGQQIITRLGSGPQTGECSDEVVTQPTNVDGDRILLFGFKDEKSFFSANHDFILLRG
jgi:hypothetical protein